MRLELVRIGNSRGIRIPKTLIEQCGLGDAVEVHVEKNRLVISPERSPRQGWREAFATAGDGAHDDLLLEGVAANAFDKEEWDW